MDSFCTLERGSTLELFENGVLVGTQTSSTAVGDPRSPAIVLGYASDDTVQPIMILMDTYQPSALLTAPLFIL